MKPLKKPFPWFGSKSLAAYLIWERIGNVALYVEPFVGSGSILLARPHEPHTEIINDRDGFVTNFWRAVQRDPEQVAQHADYPMNEIDLRARHRWLLEQTDFLSRMEHDPDYYDAKGAGWWVWGLPQNRFALHSWCIRERKLTVNLLCGVGVHNRGNALHGCLKTVSREAPIRAGTTSASGSRPTASNHTHS